MHLSHITKRELADGLDVTPEYVSMVLNGHREPSGAEERFRAALARLIAAKKTAPADESGDGESGPKRG